MRKASRLFEIIQILRLAKRPVTAATIAEQLEVVPRSIYRDIEALQGMRVPIEGSRGLGYMLRGNFTLPPMMFSIEEIEAIILSLALLDRTADTSLKSAAESVARKIASAVPEPLQATFDRRAIHAWGDVQPTPGGVDLADVRSAIRDERKLALDYVDETGSQTTRTIQPIAIVYYSAWTTFVAWCELRQSLRSFRSDRVKTCRITGERFQGEGDRLRKLWMASWSTTTTSSS
jgi:predicted DNA-binding transcriptional regulator YafY